MEFDVYTRDESEETISSARRLPGRKERRGRETVSSCAQRRNAKNEISLWKIREAAPRNGADAKPRRPGRYGLDCREDVFELSPIPRLSLYLNEADARGGAFDVDEYRPRERDLVLILVALFPGHFHGTDSPTTVGLIAVISIYVLPLG